MSILLDALRKSEKSRQQVSPPTIHATDHIGPVSTLKGRGLLMLLLALVLILGGWFIWQRYSANADGYQNPVTLASNDTRVITTPVVRLDTDGKVEYLDTASKPALNALGKEQRTPVEKYRDEATGPSESATAISANPVNKPVAPTTDKSKKSPAVESGTKPTKPAQTNAVQDTSATAKGTAKKPASKPASIPAKKPAKKPATKPVPKPDPISYWELPDAIRDKIPEIKFSVLVYAQKPADRFVLIGGQRLRENDRLSQEVQVKEIRRDGVIFKHRLYEFLVER